MAQKTFKPNSLHQKLFIDAVMDPSNTIVTLLSGRQAGKSWAGAAALGSLIYNSDRMKRGVAWCVAIDNGQSKAAQDAFTNVLGFFAEGGAIVNHLIVTNTYELYQGCWNGCKGCRGVGKHSFKPFYRVEFKSAENPDSLRGRAVDAVWFDEAALLAEYAYMTVLPVVLATGGPIFCTTTPMGKNWFYEKVYMESLRNQSYKFIRATTDDNPDLSKRNKEFIKNQYSGIRYEQEILGEFKTMVGLVYSFDSEKHTYGPKDLELPDGEIIGGLDFGYKDPFVYVWVLKGNDGRYYVLDEIYQTGTTIDKAAELIRANPLERRVTKRYADPSRPDLRAMLERDGIGTWMAKNDIQYGLNVVAKHLDSGLLLINRERCIHGVRELSNYQWKAGKQGEQPQDKDNHFCDALRYVLASEDSFGVPKDLPVSYTMDDGTVVVEQDGERSLEASHLIDAEELLDFERQQMWDNPEGGVEEEER